MKVISSPVQFFDRCVSLGIALSHIKKIHTHCEVGNSFSYLDITSDDGYFGSVVLSIIFRYFPFEGKHFYVIVCPDSIRVEYI